MKTDRTYFIHLHVWVLPLFTTSVWYQLLTWLTSHSFLTLKQLLIISSRCRSRGRERALAWHCPRAPNVPPTTTTTATTTATTATTTTTNIIIIVIIVINMNDTHHPLPWTCDFCACRRTCRRARQLLFVKPLPFTRICDTFCTGPVCASPA